MMQVEKGGSFITLKESSGISAAPFSHSIFHSDLEDYGSDSVCPTGTEKKGKRKGLSIYTAPAMCQALC